MNILKPLPFLLIILACNKAKNEKTQNLAFDIVSPVSYSDETKTVSFNPQKQIVLKTANISIRSDNFSQSSYRLKDLISRFHILIQDQKENTDAGNHNGTYTLRVPAANLEEVIDSIRSIGVECTQNEIKSEDASGEYTDNETRIKTKRDVYYQYMNLLKQAKNVEEILKVQESARVLLEEIESMESRQKYLQNHSQYSTINLIMYEYINHESNEKGFWYTAKKQFIEGYHLCLNFLLFFITIWPFVILILVAFFVCKRIKRFFAGRWDTKISK